MSAPPRDLAVGVIGPGRVGATLGAALARAGHRVVAATPASDRERARMLLPDTVTAPLPQVVATGRDLLLVAVPDDALAAVVGEIAAADPPAGCVVAHTSGAHGLGVLAPLTARGCHPLALHPAMTFTGAVDGDRADLRRLPGTGYGVTADATLRPFATRLVADLGGSCEWVADQHRPLYHAALAHGANHLVTLVNDAADQLRHAGVRRPGELLAPLLRAALDNALRLGDQALTGPVVRGDAGTVGRHLTVLDHAAPDAAPTYRALARRTTDRALAAGRLAPDTAAPLLALLTPAGPSAPGPARSRSAA